MAGRVNYDHPAEVCLLSFSSRKLLFFPFYFYFVEFFFFFFLSQIGLFICLDSLKFSYKLCSVNQSADYIFRVQIILYIFSVFFRLYSVCFYV